MKNKLAILFYIFSLLFAVITIYLTVDGLIALSKSASDYGVSIMSEWITVLKSILATSGGFLGFSLVLLGIGLILNKIDKNDD